MRQFKIDAGSVSTTRVFEDLQKSGYLVAIYINFYLRFSDVSFHIRASYSILICCLLILFVRWTAVVFCSDFVVSRRYPSGILTRSMRFMNSVRPTMYNFVIIVIAGLSALSVADPSSLVAAHNPQITLESCLVSLFAIGAAVSTCTRGLIGDALAGKRP